MHKEFLGSNMFLPLIAWEQIASSQLSWAFHLQSNGVSECVMCSFPIRFRDQAALSTRSHWMTRCPHIYYCHAILHAHCVREKRICKGFCHLKKQTMKGSVFGVSQSYIWSLLTKPKRFENTLANCTMAVATMLQCWGLLRCEWFGGVGGIRWDPMVKRKTSP